MQIICRACGEYKKHKARGLCIQCYRKEWKKKNPNYHKEWYKNNSEIKEKNRKWKRENPEKIKRASKKWEINNSKRRKKQHKNWYKKNKKRLNAQAKKWYEENKKKRLIKINEWRQDNPERVRKNKLKWRHKNPGKTREYKFKRRANGSIKKGIISKLINENIFKYGITTCEKCRKPCPNKYHIDHVIPVSKDGDNSYGNLQVLCASCNVEKRTKIVDYRKKVDGKQLYIKPSM